MTIVLDIPQELTERLSDAGIAPDKAQEYALAALSDAADSDEVRRWWDGLSSGEQERERELTRASSELGDAGRWRSIDEVVDRIRTKHHGPDSAQ